MKRRWLASGVLVTFTVFMLYLSSRVVRNRVATVRLAGEKDKNPRSNRDLKKILYWNSFFGYEDYAFGFGRAPFVKNNCPVDNCLVTNRRDVGPNLEDFDAIIFHAWQLGWITKRALSARRRPHQRYVFFLLESPSIHRSRLDHLTDFFNWTMTYRRDSDIYRPYSLFVPVNESRSYLDLDQMRHPVWADPVNATPVEVPSGKTRLVAWFVSNCRTPGKRELYVQELSKHVQVDVYGKCGSPECPWHKRGECLRRYKFYLSFENSLCRDYATEKLFSVMRHDVVPVVYGGADYREVAPPGSYVDTKDFANPERLAEHLKYLDANPREYAKYLSWKRSYAVRDDVMALAMCKLCAMLNDPSLPPKSYGDIHQWYGGPPVCRYPVSKWSRYRRR
ncbi:alpha-(1,3)-fucosyltransferase C-like [Bacillus rossius redtenbacheri]|uniref:alpha-(1,3)-fucosyltransferase C-like n=1 Tax=Bacillus rossius redtenbacheri TaxID=93214 RepID=UPI002FDE806E